MYEKYGTVSSEAVSIHVRKIPLEWMLGVSSEPDPQFKNKVDPINVPAMKPPPAVNLCSYLEGQNESERARES